MVLSASLDVGGGVISLFDLLQLKEQDDGLVKGGFRHDSHDGKVNAWRLVLLGQTVSYPHSSYTTPFTQMTLTSGLVLMSPHVGGRS
jgi:hypothetical protein